MARQKYNYLSDELIAESLQVTNYLEQSRSSRLNVLQLDGEKWLENYFNRYEKASPRLQFHIFSFELLYSKNGMVLGRCKGVVVLFELFEVVFYTLIQLIRASWLKYLPFSRG